MKDAEQGRDKQDARVKSPLVVAVKEATPPEDPFPDERGGESAESQEDQHPALLVHHVEAVFTHPT